LNVSLDERTDGTASVPDPQDLLDRPMKIVNVECDFLIVEITVPITERKIDYGMLLVTLETDTGLRGTGIAREHDFHALAVKQVINDDIAPFLKSREANITPEKFWNDAAHDLVRDWMAPAGVVARANSAIDQALWDIRGQALGQPIYRLLGGVQPEIEMYATFGLNFYTPEEEVAAALRLQKMGHTAFKLMGAKADRGRDISVDIGRVKRLRETVGPDAKIILDGRNNYSLYQAIQLSKAIEQYDLAYFDEPIWAKDADAMVRLKQAVPGIPIAARGRGGNLWDNRTLVTSGAVDVMGIQVLDQGGFSQAIKVAHLAEMYQLPIVTGGGWYMHNAHLIGAVPNGWMTEYHVLAAPVCETIFNDTIQPVNGRYKLSERPGLGMTLNDDAVREAKARAKLGEESRTEYRLPH
jgi:L-alanine-DL-glutamate epimerase-like enolase superfamily enzyme